MNNDEVRIKIRKPKKIAPRFLIVIDDMSDEIKNNPSLNLLMKQNRWCLCKLIISSQFLLDIKPECRYNVDVWILFKNMELDRLKKIHNETNPTVNFEEFLKMYKDATSGKYDFFYIDKQNGEYRKNFNIKYKT